MSRDPPTVKQWDTYQKAFDYYNELLFDGELPQCILNFSRKSRCWGFFAPDRWTKGSCTIHEISLNPEGLANRPPVNMMGTLVHEMVHLWQCEYGKPSRRGYHNKEWAAKMEAVGLMPSDTAKPGCQKTGFRVSHYPIESGLFLKVFQAMPQDYLMPWLHIPTRKFPVSGQENEPGAETEEESEVTSNSKVKFSCSVCKANAWGKPSSNLLCGKYYDLNGVLVRMSGQRII